MNNSEADLDAKDRGIFVLPYEPPDLPSSSQQAGPSRPPKRPRLLQELYESSLGVYRRAYEEYEEDRTSEQLDDIGDWLEVIEAKKAKGKERFSRIAVGVLQNAGRTLTDALQSTATGLRVVQLHGRDVSDLNTGLRAIALGLVGDKLAPKAGRTPLDEVERWWRASKTRSTLLLHITQAQIVSTQVLAELIYVLTLHPTLPFRVLLSVPSASTFLNSWSHIEPSSIDLSVLGTTTKGRRKGAAVGAILRARSGDGPSIRLSEDLVEELKKEEEMFGAGPEGALKAIQWELLRHSYTSPLASIEQGKGDESDERFSAVRSILDRLKSDPEANIPGREMFELPPSGDRQAVLDPAPRIAILHALSEPSAWTSRVVDLKDGPHPPRHSAMGVSGAEQDLAPDVVETIHEKEASHLPSPRSPSTPTRASKRSKRVVSAGANPALPSSEPPANPSPNDNLDTVINGELPSQEGLAIDAEQDRAGGLQDLQNLFELWKSAGRNVNLWDWFEGFRSMAGSRAEEGGDEGRTDENAEGVGSEVHATALGPAKGSDLVERPEEEGDESLHGVQAGKRRKGKGRAVPYQATVADMPSQATTEDDTPIDHVQSDAEPAPNDDIDGERDDDAEKEPEQEQEDHLDDRLHATFVRFCEEARMLGLVRARGKGVRRGADEVVKGIGMV